MCDRPPVYAIGARLISRETSQPGNRTASGSVSGHLWARLYHPPPAARPSRYMRLLSVRNQQASSYYERTRAILLERRSPPSSSLPPSLLRIIRPVAHFRVRWDAARVHPRQGQTTSTLTVNLEGRLEGRGRSAPNSQSSPRTPTETLCVTLGRDFLGEAGARAAAESVHAIARCTRNSIYIETMVSLVVIAAQLASRRGTHLLSRNFQPVLKI
jgi:hypothetical protein